MTHGFLISFIGINSSNLPHPVQARFLLHLAENRAETCVIIFVTSMIIFVTMVIIFVTSMIILL